MIYKKHEIARIVVYRDDCHGPYWIIDDNMSMAFGSGKDAKAYINGQKPRWGIVDLKAKGIELSQD